LPLVIRHASSANAARLILAAVVLRLSFPMQCVVTAGHAVVLHPANAVVFGAPQSLGGFGATALTSLAACFVLDWRMRCAYLQANARNAPSTGGARKGV